MRLSNRNREPLYRIIESAVYMGVATGVAVCLLGGKFGLQLHYRCIILAVAVLCATVYFAMGKQIFEYDSDGEALNFKNRNIVAFLRKTVSDEFPKYKVKKYEVVSFLLIKRLYITISSKKSASTVLKYDISFLTGKQIRDLKFSLNKVIKANNAPNNE